MSRELREEVELELAMLRRHLETFATLRQEVELREPDAVETMALAGMLQSFYNGVENIFKRVAVHCDGGPPSGGAWHRRLLASMADRGVKRLAVISEEFARELEGYLDFRHVFRGAYGFELRWRRMATLVKGCEGTLNGLEEELTAFFKARETGGRQGGLP
ncbi:MAG: hypothetical protein V2A58_09985 [Planctomycetota bacterium]